MKQNRLGSYSLLAACAFPVHFWTILWILNDVSWISKDTSVGGAIGAAAYGLVFAFIESLAVFLFAVFLTKLFPKNWPRRVSFPVVSIIIWGILLWGILGQLFFVFGKPHFPAFDPIFQATQHPLRILYGLILSAVIASLGLPLLVFFRSNKFQNLVLALMERIETLTIFYFFLDLISLMIVIYRNV